MSNWRSKLRDRLEMLRRLRSPRDGWLLLHIFLFAIAAPVLARLELAKLQSLLEPKRTSPIFGLPDSQKIIDFLNFVRCMGRPLVSSRCLTRGLTLYYFLRRAGLDVGLCFGMGKSGASFAGHCWLVKDDEPFLEARDPRPLFAEFYRFPTKNQAPNLSR
jgi:hypothetical protein